MRTLLLILVCAISLSTQAQRSESKPVISSVKKKSYNGSDISCATANDGEITITATGGSGNYLYSGDGGNTFQSSNVFTGLVNNTTYAFFVKDAKTGLVSNGVWQTISFLNPVTISSPLQVIRKPSCFSSADGIIQITAYGGTGKLSYTLDGKTFQNDGGFKGLSAGTYQVTISDVNGCSVVSAPISLEGPATLNIEISSFKTNFCSNGTNSITFRGTGSTGDYNYSLDGQPFVWKSRNDFHTYSNLQEGNHQIVIMDNYNKCSFTYSFAVTNPLSASLTASDRVCAGGKTFLRLSIQKGIALSQVNERYTAVYKDEKGNTVTLANLTEGTHIIDLGQLAATTTYELISVKSSAGCAANIKHKVATVEVMTDRIWLGKNTNWNDPANWTCNIIPDASSTVRIAKTENNPVINGIGALVGDLFIDRDAEVVVKSKLQIHGEILVSEYTLNASAGTIELAGKKVQWIKGSQLKNRTLQNMIVSNNAGVQVGNAVDDTLNITGTISFGTPTASLHSGDNITLKSTATGTASIGKVQPGNTIRGQFIVERFIFTGTDKSKGQHGKAWMLLSTPTIGSTIFESWQESNKSTGKTPIENLQPGYGILLTTAHNKVPSNGYDLYTGAGSSIKTYQPATGYDKGPESTHLPIYNEKGYMVLVRGDRSVYTAKADAVPVVLRTKGELITGNTKPIDIPADKFASIGNPYASRISIKQIQRTGGVDDIFYLWDPALGGSYSLGGFQTLVNLGDGYIAIPGGGSYGRGKVEYIESGHGFFVQTTGKPGSVYFTEDAKSGSSKLMGRGAAPSAVTASFATNLYNLSAEAPVLTDGNLLLMGDFTNDIDGSDARKMSNSSESFSILSSGVALSVESRQMIQSDDTIRFQMSGLLAQNYRLEFTGSRDAMPGMQAWLIDQFTATQTLLNLQGTTTFDFTVNTQKGSSAANRFMIIFRPAQILPVVFTGVHATIAGDAVNVEWKVESEQQVKEYQIERSADGQNFSFIASVAASMPHGGTYQKLDLQPVSGISYYRIRSVDLDGKSSLSQTVKVQFSGYSSAAFTAYPNPVVGNVVSIQAGNLTQGTYNLRVLNPVGQVVLTKKIAHAGGNLTEKINWDSTLPRGVYHVEISNAQSGTQSIKLLF